MLGSGADGSAQTVGGGCGSEVERAMHRSNIVAASAWETKSEGHAAEWQKDLKRVREEAVGNPWEIPRLSRDIQDFRGIMRGNGSRSQAKVQGGGRLHGARRWTMECLTGVWRPACIASERNGRRYARAQLSGQCPEVAEQWVGDVPKVYDV